ncbi:bone sialoprotein 2 [Pelobates fuscus]|uniref:bone sialoprotein 2 n=1 Tax=Pelobates fuscus TaxID=191477 RepID=UPI002FE43F4F
MKTAIILIFLVGLSSAFYINRFQRRWKGSDSDEKALARNRHGYFFRNMNMQPPPFKHYISNVKGGDSSEENGESSDEEDSSEVSKNGNNAGPTRTETGKGAEEEANSDEGEESENENGGTSAPEVEETTSNMNETETENGEQWNTTDSHVQTEPMQTSTIAVDVTETPASIVDETLGIEEGSNGGIVSTTPYEPTNNGYQYENGYEHENEAYYKGRGDTYARYEDEYHYRNRVYDHYGREYEYYQ